MDPDAVAGQGAIEGSVERVVDRDDDGQQPSDNGQRLVGDDGTFAVVVSLSEGVY